MLGINGGGVKSPAILKEKNMSDKDNELQALRNRIAELEKKDAERGQTKGFSAFNEIEKIRSKGKSTSEHLQYKDVKNYSPVYMYDTNGIDIGRVRGPWHPTNAERAFQDFFKIGIILSINRPSEDQIAEYMKTKEYKDLKAKHDKKSALKNKSRKESEVEKLTKAVSELSGIAIDKVNKIKSPEEVGLKR